MKYCCVLNMTGNKFTLWPLLIVALLIAYSPAATAAGDSPEKAKEETGQPQGMEENLEDSIPQGDLELQQGLDNPRIVIPENPDEIPEMQVVSGEYPAHWPMCCNTYCSDVGSIAVSPWNGSLKARIR